MFQVIFNLIFLLTVFFIETPSLAQSEREPFRIRDREDRGTLDWNYGEVNVDLIFQLMEGLVTTNESGEPIPGLAEKWSSSTDLKTWTFTIRKTARWSDGRVVCARDFKDSLERLLTPGLSPFAHYFFNIRGAKDLNEGKTKRLESVTARICQSLEIVLENPSRDFPSLMTHWTTLPIRKDKIGAFGNKWMKPENLVTTGPYKLTAWIPNQKFQLDLNPTYYGPRPRIEKLEFLVVPEDNTALTLFESGQLDFLEEVPLLDRARMQKSPEYKTFPSHVGYYLGFNLKDSKTKNLKFRHALTLALNLDEIPKILRGGEIPGWSWLPPTLRPKDSPGSFQFDVTKAKALLAESGMDPKSPLNVYYYTKNIHIPVMEWVQEQWRKNLSLNVQLQPVEGKVYWSQVTLKNYPVFLSGVTAYYNSAIPFFTEFRSDSHANWTYFANSKFDAKVMEAETKVEALKESEKILLDDQHAIIPLYFRSSTVLIRGIWKGGVWINPLTYFYVKNFQ